MGKIKRRIKLYRHLVFEIVETLIAICLVLERTKINHSVNVSSHIKTLDDISNELRKEWWDKK